MTMEAAPQALAGLGWAAEAAGFGLLGYSAPEPLADPSLAEAARAAHTDGSAYVRNPHTTAAAVRCLLRDAALATRVANLCGHGLQIWRSAFFSKADGAGEIAWHHDKHFFDGDGDIRLDETRSHFSVLFALTDISTTTGLLQLIPGSHRDHPAWPRDQRPYHRRPPADHFLGQLPEAIAASARPLPIPAGSFVVFHSALLHRSLAHAGGPPRLGLAIRLARIGLRVPDELAAPADIFPFPPPP